MVKVLVVDDDPDLRVLISKLVGMLGAEAIQARDGVDAESVVMRSNPDMILMDIMMPNQDGVVTCARLRAQGFSGPIILLSAMSEFTGRTRATECGATAYLQKPMSRATLKPYLDNIRTSLSTESI